MNAKTNITSLIMTIEQLLQDSPTFPGYIEKSGSILYSAVSTLCKGNYYLLGYNPGGDPAAIQTSIQHAINELPLQTVNAYLDEDWSGHRAYPVGKAPFQLRVQYLLKALGERPEIVCASNLIFARSHDANGTVYPAEADLCWPVHELILNIVQPRAILSIGSSEKSAFAFIRNRMGNPAETAILAEHGNWSVRATRGAIGSQEITLIGLPHLSRYSIIGKQKVINWIRQQAGELRPAV